MSKFMTNVLGYSPNQDYVACAYENALYMETTFATIESADEAYSSILGAVDVVTEGLIDKIKDGFKYVWGKIQAFCGWIKNKIKDAWNWIKGLFNKKKKEDAEKAKEAEEKAKEDAKKAKENPNASSTSSNPKLLSASNSKPSNSKPEANKPNELPGYKGASLSSSKILQLEAPKDLVINAYISPEMMNKLLGHIESTINKMITMVKDVSKSPMVAEYKRDMRQEEFEKEMEKLDKELDEEFIQRNEGTRRVIPADQIHIIEKDFKVCYDNVNRIQLLAADVEKNLTDFANKEYAKLDKKTINDSDPEDVQNSNKNFNNHLDHENKMRGISRQVIASAVYQYNTNMRSTVLKVLRGYHTYIQHIINKCASYCGASAQAAQFTSKMDANRPSVSAE